MHQDYRVFFSLEMHQDYRVVFSLEMHQDYRVFFSLEMHQDYRVFFSLEMHQDYRVVFVEEKLHRNPFQTMLKKKKSKKKKALLFHNPILHHVLSPHLRRYDLTIRLTNLTHTNHIGTLLFAVSFFPKVIHLLLLTLSNKFHFSLHLCTPKSSHLSHHRIINQERVAFELLLLLFLFFLFIYIHI
jgi:hypothetical protein